MDFNEKVPKQGYFNEVTSFSKVAAAVIFIALPFIGFWFGMNYAPTPVITQSYQLPGTDMTQDVVEDSVFQSLDIVSDYKISKFKIVGLVRNQFYSDESKYSSFYVVTERGVNDSSCGGVYGPSTCYFFLESEYYGVDSVTYIGSWGDNFAAIDTTTIKFLNPNTIEFIASGGDAGVGVYEKWSLDIATGSSTLIEKTVSELTE